MQFECNYNYWQGCLYINKTTSPSRCEHAITLKSFLYSLEILSSAFPPHPQEISDQPSVTVGWFALSRNLYE